MSEKRWLIPNVKELVCGWRTSTGVECLERHSHLTSNHLPAAFPDCVMQQYPEEFAGVDRALWQDAAGYAGDITLVDHMQSCDSDDRFEWHPGEQLQRYTPQADEHTLRLVQGDGAAKDEPRSELRWQEGKPTETGWYWVEDRLLGAHVVEVKRYPGDSRLMLSATTRGGQDAPEPLDQWTDIRRYAGPIPEPLS